MFVLQNLLIELQDIVCVSSITDRDRPGKTVFGIYLHSRLAETKRLPVLKFTTPTEEDREDWVSQIDFFSKSQYLFVSLEVHISLR